MSENRVAITLTLNGGQQVRGVISGLTGDVQSLTGAVNSESRAAQSAMAENVRSFGAMEASMASVKATAIGLFGTFTAAAAIKEFITTADTIKLLDSRIQLASKSNEDYISSYKKLIEISLATRTDFEANAQIFARTNKAIELMGGSAKTTTRYTELLAKGLKISGTSAGEAASVIRQMSQALASGVLRGDEFNSLMENGSRVAYALAAGLHVSVGELRSMAENGKLTSATVINALMSQADAIDSEFNRIQLTVSDAMQNVKTQFGQYVRAVDSGSGATSALASSINGIAGDLPAVISGLVTLGEAAAAVFASQMAAGIAAYATAKASSIATERAHSAAILENQQVNLARTQAVMQSTTAELAAARAEHFSAIETRANIAAGLTAVDTQIAQARATIAATEATVQHTSVQFINRQATEQLALAESHRAFILESLTALEAEQVVMADRMASAATAQAAAARNAAIAEESAAVATTSLTASMRLLLNPLNLINVGLSAMVGWQIGEWLNQFAVVQDTATKSVGFFATALENVNYVRERAKLLANGDTAGVEALTAAHEKQLSSIKDNIQGSLDYRASLEKTGKAGAESAKAVGQLSDSANGALAVDSDLVRSRIDLLKAQGKIQEAYELEATAIKKLNGEQAKEYVSNELAIDQLKQKTGAVDKLQQRLDSINSGKYKQQIIGASNKYGVDPLVALTVAELETQSGRNIKTSSGNAKGLMQMLPAAAIDAGKVTGYSVSQIRSNDPMLQGPNIESGVAYLKIIIDRLGKNATVPNILAAYNGGAGALSKSGFNPALMRQEAANYSASGTKIYNATVKATGATTGFAEAQLKARNAGNELIASIQKEIDIQGLNGVQHERAIELQNALKNADASQIPEITKILQLKWAMADAQEKQNKQNEATRQYRNEIDAMQDATKFEESLAAMAKELQARGLNNEQIKNRIDLERQLNALKEGHSDIPPATAKAEITRRQTATASIDQTLVDATPKATNKSLNEYVKSLDNAKAKTASLGEVTQAVFNGSLGGINAMAGAFDSMVNAISSNTAALEENRKKQAEIQSFQPSLDKDQYLKDLKIKNDALDKSAKEEQGLNAQTTSAKIGGARQIAGAVSSMLKQGSTEQRAAHAVEMGLAGIEMAMNLKKVLGIGQVVAETVKSVGPTVAASQTKGMAKASEAVATQASAGPYVGFALMAAMAVAMAAIGFNTGAKGDIPVSGKIPESPDSGTVLGDPTAKSESINHVVTTLNDIHASEYRELRGINQGVQALQSGITNSITKLFQSGGLTILTGLNLGTKANVGGEQAISAAVNKFLFGSVKREVTDQGIYAGGKQTIGALQNGANLQSSQYTEITTTKKGGLFGGTSKSAEEIASALNPEFKSALTQIFKGMGQSMQSMATTFGADMADVINQYTIPKLKVSLFGLSADKMTTKLNNVLSTQMDKMTTKIFGGLIAQYQKLGEGMFETASRLASEKAVVLQALQVSGVGFGGDAVAMADGIMQLAGGLKEFQSQFQDYYSKFFTEAEQFSQAKNSLSSQLGDFGKPLPATRQAYRDLANAQDLNTIAGRKLYATLLQLSGSANDYYTKLEDLSSTAEDNLRSLAGLGPTVSSSIADVNKKLIEARANWYLAGLDVKTMADLTATAFDSLKAKLTQPFVDAKSSITDSLASAQGKQVAPTADINAMMAALSKMTDPSEQITQINKIQTAIKKKYDYEISLINKTTSALSSIADFLNGLNYGDLSTLSPEEQLRAAKGAYGTNLLKAQAGDTDAQAKFSGLANQLLNVARSYYGSSKEYVNISQGVKDAGNLLIGGMQNAQEVAATAQTATEAASTQMETSLTTLSSIIDGFVTSLGTKFDSIVAKIKLPDPTAVDTTAAGTATNQAAQTPSPSVAQDSYTKLLGQRQTSIDTYATATQNAGIKGAGKAFINQQKATAKSASANIDLTTKEIQNYQYWQEHSNLPFAEKSITDMQQYVTLNAEMNAKGTKKKRKTELKGLISALYAENGGTLKFRADGGMTHGNTVFNEDGPELLNFSAPTMVTNNKNTQSIIALGNKETLEEVKKSNVELRALVRLLSESQKQQIDQLDTMSKDLAQLRNKSRLDRTAA